MEQHALKNVNNYLNTNIDSYLETSGGQSSNPYFNVVHFLAPELIRNLWEHQTAVFQHWFLIHYITKEVENRYALPFGGIRLLNLFYLFIQKLFKIWKVNMIQIFV